MPNPVDSAKGQIHYYTFWRNAYMGQILGMDTAPSGNDTTRRPNVCSKWMLLAPYLNF